MSRLTGGVFNHALILSEYDSTGLISVNNVHTAAKAKAGFTRPFSLIVTHDLSYQGLDEMLGLLHRVKIQSKVQLFDAKSGELLNSHIVPNTIKEAKTMQDAATIAVNAASTKLAEYIKGYLFKHNIS